MGGFHWFPFKTNIRNKTNKLILLCVPNRSKSRYLSLPVPIKAGCQQIGWLLVVLTWCISIRIRDLKPQAMCTKIIHTSHRGELSMGPFNWRIETQTNPNSTPRPLPSPPPPTERLSFPLGSLRCGSSFGQAVRVMENVAAGGHSRELLEMVGLQETKAFLCFQGAWFENPHPHFLAASIGRE